MDEWIALTLLTSLILGPLFAGSLPNHIPDIQGWSSLIVSAFTVRLLYRQTKIFDQQCQLMEGQLKATQTAADAALAALDRPWLVLESVGHNEIAWRERRQPLIAKFRIANYGKAPAFIKAIRVSHLRSAMHQHRNEIPDEVLERLRDSPIQNDFGQALTRYSPLYHLSDADEQIGQTPMTIVDPNFVIGGEAKTNLFCAIGFDFLRAQDFPNELIFELTESFLIGSIFYEMPGQTPEFLNFCYQKGPWGDFRIWRDWPPYNERKKA